jgi:transposase
MPWNTVDPMTQRKEFIEAILLPGSNISAICEQKKISRKTAYKWLSRYHWADSPVCQTEVRRQGISQLELIRR